MSQSGPNPVFAPIRRWVLYSRTNLVIAVVGVAAVLFAIGAVIGQDPQPRAAANTADAAGISTEPAAAADTISYDLDEVSESLVVAKRRPGLRPARRLPRWPTRTRSSTRRCRMRSGSV